MSDRLDFTDAGAVSRWLADLRTSFDDLDGAVEDMLRPPRERELGPVFHRRYYTEARTQVLQALAYAAGEEPAPSASPDGVGGGAP